MIKCLLRYFIRPALIFAAVFIIMPADEVMAGEFDNAYTFYSKHASSGEPAYLNKSDGYVYFCSWGNKSTSQTKYKTVGYTITVNISDNKDSVEVLLGGSIVKDVSTVTKSDVVYVLRRARVSRLQELFSGNANITWHQIFRKKNKYTFDAIMTVEEKGKNICGKVKESSNLRKLSAEHEAYLYRKLSGIKKAREWSNPKDLDNFFDKKVELEPVSPLEICPVNISGSNIYNYGGVWYVKKDSVVGLGIVSLFNDGEAVSKKYHPNYNVYKFSGWGDNQKYYMSQGAGESDIGKAGILVDGATGNKPVSIIGIDPASVTTYEDGGNLFISGVNFYMKAANGGTVHVIPEGRVYYNDLFPAKEGIEDNLCDIQSNADGRLDMVSDGEAPQISVPAVISSFMYAETGVPAAISDSGSGISLIRVYRNDGAVIYEKAVDGYCTYHNIVNECKIRANDTYMYYVYAEDNVGNGINSSYFKFSTPKAYTVTASLSGTNKYYNRSRVNVNVFGGSGEICSFVIMSEDNNNPSGDRVIIANQSVEAHTLPAGLKKYDYSADIMDTVKDMPDGTYVFDVISGGRYVASEPQCLTMIKDLTPPEILDPNVYVTGDWLKDSAYLRFMVNDITSGVNNIYTYCNNEYVEMDKMYNPRYMWYELRYELNNEGENRVLIKADDNAGNMSEYNLKVNIDSSPPEYSLYGGFNGSDQMYVKWITKDQLPGGIILTDKYSGIVVNKSENPLMLYSNSVTEPFNSLYYDIVQSNRKMTTIKLSQRYIDNIKSSRNRFTLKVHDRAGNELKKELWINVDCDAPELKYPDRKPWNGEECKGNVTLTDMHSGLEYVAVKCNGRIKEEYSYDSSSSTATSRTIYIDLSDYVDEVESVSVVARDNVGNAAEYDLECIDVGDRIKKLLKKVRTRIR